MMTGWKPILPLLCISALPMELRPPAWDDDRLEAYPPVALHLCPSYGA